MNDWVAYVRRFYQLSADAQKRDWEALSPEQRELFKATVAGMSASTSSGSASGRAGSPWLIALVVVGCAGAVLVQLAGLGRSSSSVRSSSKRTTFVQNSHYALSSDVQQAERFLEELPRECDGTSASAASDGAVTVRLSCRGANENLSGVVQFKNGIVTKVR